MTWAGGQVVGDDWAVYSGTSFALTGSIIDNGWRLRLVGGYARYSYAGSRRVSGERQPVTFMGQSGFADVLVGHQVRTGNLTIKAFAGISSVGHTVTPFDPSNDAVGYKYGASGAFEAWLNLNDRLWLSTETTYSTVFNSFGTTLRSGYRIQPALSIGLETGAIGNDDHFAGRAALFAAFDFGMFADNDSYLRVSAGSSGDRDIDIKPYAAISVSLKY